MRTRKTNIITIILSCILFYLALYTFRAHTVAAMHIYEDETGIIYWRSDPSDWD